MLFGPEIARRLHGHRRAVPVPRRRPPLAGPASPLPARPPHRRPRGAGATRRAGAAAPGSGPIRRDGFRGGHTGRRRPDLGDAGSPAEPRRASAVRPVPAAAAQPRGPARRRHAASLPARPRAGGGRLPPVAARRQRVRLRGAVRRSPHGSGPTRDGLRRESDSGRALVLRARHRRDPAQPRPVRPRREPVRRRADRADRRAPCRASSACPSGDGG